MLGRRLGGRVTVGRTGLVIGRRKTNTLRGLSIPHLQHQVNFSRLLRRFPGGRQRRKPHGSAWHWKQTDCWRYTPPGTKKRTPIFDEQGQRIRGKENQQLAEMALAHVKVADESQAADSPASREGWLVAPVCSECLQYCQRGVANSTISKGRRDNAVN